MISLQEKKIPESFREISVVDSVDVMVCGAGPAGVCAAIRAAREGVRVRLLELHGCLGGIWTAGLLTYVLDAEKPDGLISEIVERLQRRDAWHPRNLPNFTYDPEQMKLILEEMCGEAGVEIRYHTRVVAAHVESGTLRGVITESKSGREAWLANVFIDCTGDGDLAALAGCGYSLGRESTGETQPMSLLAMIAGLDADYVRRFHDSKNPHRKEELYREIERGGYSASYSSPALFYIRDDLCTLMANHYYLVRPDDAEGITQATIRCRREIDLVIQALRKSHPAWKDVHVVATAEQIGVREGRRIHGLETVTEDDLASGRSRENAVCQARFGMDVHSPNPAFSKDYDHTGRRPVKPYDIPYGALVARDVEGLMMAGRCISGDFLSHSSYRVTGNAVVMGEAAGKYAALCVLNNKRPHEYVRELVT